MQNLAKFVIFVQYHIVTQKDLAIMYINLVNQLNVACTGKSMTSIQQQLKAIGCWEKHCTVSSTTTYEGLGEYFQVVLCRTSLLLHFIYKA